MKTRNTSIITFNSNYTATIYLTPRKPIVVNSATTFKHIDMGGWSGYSLKVQSEWIPFSSKVARQIAKYFYHYAPGSNCDYYKIDFEKLLK